MTRKLISGCGAALAVCALVAIAGPALAKTARCVIKSSDGPAYSGACDFTLGAGGSFSIAPVGQAVFAPGVTMLSVDIEGNNAEVHGLTTDGVNSRWGPATRSAKDKACWIGEDFSICVY